MVELHRVELVLVGTHAGKTITVHGRRYVQGVFRADVRADQVEHLIRAGARLDGSFPRGSREQAVAEDRINGRAHPEKDTDAEVRGVHDVLSPLHVRPGDPAAEAEGLHGRGDGDAPGGAVRVRADRDRYQDTRIHGQAEGRLDEGDAPERSGPVNLKLAAAIRVLDPENDEFWTVEGLPKLSAIEEAYGCAGLTREDVDAAVPEWDRDAALTAALNAIA